MPLTHLFLLSLIVLGYIMYLYLVKNDIHGFILDGAPRCSDRSDQSYCLHKVGHWSLINWPFSHYLDIWRCTPDVSPTPASVSRLWTAAPASVSCVTRVRGPGRGWSVSKGARRDPGYAWRGQHNQFSEFCAVYLKQNYDKTHLNFLMMKESLLYWVLV